MVRFIHVHTVFCFVVAGAVRIQRSTKNGQCPEGSDTFTVPVHQQAEQKHDYNRVVMADYPSTGSSWLRNLVHAVSIEAGQCASPACTIYGDGKFCLKSSPHVKCECSQGWQPAQGALFFKTHFPCQEQYYGHPFKSWQYEASSRFDKLLLLVRHPVSTIRSNIQRWGGGDHTADNLKCWGLWWDRARKAVGESNVHVLRYEDLCLDTAKTLHGFLKFMGGCYDGISLKSIEATLSRNPKLGCYYTHDLERMTTSRESVDDYTANVMADLMQQWGYSTQKNEWAASGNVSHLPGFLASKVGRNATDLAARNPWSSVSGE